MRYTVIIPVYNAADQIGRALESVQKQSVKDLEIICINDGSEDNSLEILRDHASKDKRIKVFDQPNKGAAAGRNFALDLAQGEYIAFLDADDAYGDEEALEKIYHTANANHAEICMAKMYSVANGKKKEVIRINDMIAQRPRFRFRDLQYDFFFPTYVYKRDFLNENNLRFPIRKIYEDPIFLINAMMKTSYVYCVDVEYYIYFWEKKTRVMTLETMEDLLDGILEVMEIAADNNYYILKDEIFSRIDNMYYEEVCRYANSPSVLQRLIRVNDYENKERFGIRVLRYLMEFGWSRELYLTKKLDKLRGLQVKEQEVVIYAAGGAGIDCFELNRRYKEFKLAAWVDVNKAGEEINEIPIKDIEYLNDLQFDKIIVAIRDDQIYNEIVTKLMGMGIESGNILRWK